jgi:hypothetical protein
VHGDHDSYSTAVVGMLRSNVFIATSPFISLRREDEGKVTDEDPEACERGYPRTLLTNHNGKYKQSGVMFFSEERIG